MLKSSTVLSSSLQSFAPQYHSSHSLVDRPRRLYSITSYYIFTPRLVVFYPCLSIVGGDSDIKRLRQVRPPSYPLFNIQLQPHVPSHAHIMHSPPITFVLPCNEYHNPITSSHSLTSRLGLIMKTLYTPRSLLPCIAPILSGLWPVIIYNGRLEKQATKRGPRPGSNRRPLPNCLSSKLDPKRVC
jgi:hypothetical protein